MEVKEGDPMSNGRRTVNRKFTCAFYKENSVTKIDGGVRQCFSDISDQLKHISFEEREMDVAKNISNMNFFVN